MIKDKFLIPILDELLYDLHGTKYFSKIDLTLSSYQIIIREEDIPKTYFCTHEGIYEFWVIPFGLSNAHVSFQEVMNVLFRLYLQNLLVVFFDDILVYIKN